MAFHTKSKLRNAGLLFALIFTIIFIIIPYLIHQEVRTTALVIPLLVFSLSIISPYSLRTPYDLWIKLGYFLGKINSSIILILFFYILVTPVAIIRKIYSKVFLNKKIKTLYNKDVSNFKDFNFKDQF